MVLDTRVLFCGDSRGLDVYGAVREKGMPQATVMVVDDDEAICRLVVLALSRVGYTVIPIGSGASALEKLTLVQPDLIIMDILMPFLNGLDVVRQIRADPQTALIPVMFLSSQADPAAKHEGISAGGQLYLTKPFKVNELLQNIRDLLENSKDSCSHSLPGDSVRGCP